MFARCHSYDAPYRGGTVPNESGDVVDVLNGLLDLCDPLSGS